MSWPSLHRFASDWERNLGATKPPSVRDLARLWLPWSVGSAILTSLLDLLIGGYWEPQAWTAALGLAVVGGALLGLGLVVSLRLSWLLPKRGRPFFGMLLGVLLALWLADRLGVLENFDGPHRALAVAAGIGSFGVALLVGVLFAASFPAPVRPIVAAFPRGRRVFTLILTLASVSAVIVDRRLFPGGYAEAHHTLCWFVVASLAVFGAALGPTLPALRTALARSALGGAIAMLVVAPFLLLRGEELPRTSAIAQTPFAALHLDIVRNLTDVDFDGYSALLGGGDCAAFDHDVNPSAPEIEDNGVDDNCVSGDRRTTSDEEVDDVPALTADGAIVNSNVVLITVDTLRPDRMSAYGYERDTTPAIARWAAGATRFSEAYTSGGWTTLAIPSLMTGRYPRHLIWDRLVSTSKRRAFRFPLEQELKSGEKIRSHFLLPVDDPTPHLAEILQARGMATLAVVDSGFTRLLAKRWGFGRGFDEFVDVTLTDKARRGDEGTATLGVAALKRRDRARPFFMWLHFFGPHAPNSRHEGVPIFGESGPDGYDHEVAFADLQIGRVLDELETVDERPTAVILTADHGERFYSGQRRGHGRDASEDSIRIPLIVQAQGFEPGVRDGLVSLVDVVPTVLALTESPAPKRLDGMPLNHAPDADRAIFSDSFALAKHGKRFKYDRAVCLMGEHKLISDRVGSVLELNARSDRTEAARNLFGHVDFRRIQSALNAYIEASGGPPSIRGR